MSEMFFDNEGIPDFFILGAPKCGTTTLYAWLADHPQVHAPHKEPGFFSQDIFQTESLRTHIPTLKEYREIFKIRDGKKRVCGEATPRYLYSDMALKTISELRPSARLIVCVRDPVDLVVSYHNQKLREGREREADFEKAWRRSFREDLSCEERLGFHEIKGEINYVFWAALGRRLEALYNLFEPKQVLVVRLTELKDKPMEVYKSLISFIGVDDDGRTDFPALNQKVKIRNVYLHRVVYALSRRLRLVLEPIYQARGGRGLGFKRLINRWNVSQGEYTSEVSAQLRHEISEFLREDMLLADQLLCAATQVGEPT